MRRSGGLSIDKELIESFVLRTLSANDRDVEEFLGEEFREGMMKGTWLFLFDSFDELPDVLGSTEADETIRQYGEAIHEFLHGMNRCRGIVASRHFRGPAQLTWPRFRVLPLSRERWIKLIRKNGLSVESEGKLIAWADGPGQDLHLLVRNPMFLGLVCNHVRKGNPLPPNPHMVFETYIKSRLEVDAPRLLERYGVRPSDVREVAEQVAFCMAADAATGLRPSRADLGHVMEEHGFAVGALGLALDALEYMKLARGEPGVDPGDPPFFTFAHRRFQEYFATCLLLREPNRVTPEQLLSDARWREAVVVMCQTQSTSVLSALVEEARLLMVRVVGEAKGWKASSVAGGQGGDQKQGLRAFEWPHGAAHLCAVLQDGFGSRLNDLPADVRELAAELLQIASESGDFASQRWALEIAGAVPPDRLLYFIRRAFRSNSLWLRDTAYLQAARLVDIPHDVAKGIREALVKMARYGILRRERFSTRAHLARLNDSWRCRSSLRLLEWTGPINGSFGDYSG